MGKLNIKEIPQKSDNSFSTQAASPACTELETIVLDWLGE
jgi:hypothetical protein